MYGGYHMYGSFILKNFVVVPKDKILGVMPLAIHDVDVDVQTVNTYSF